MQLVARWLWATSEVATTATASDINIFFEWGLQHFLPKSLVCKDLQGGGQYLLHVRHLNLGMDSRISWISNIFKHSLLKLWITLSQEQHLADELRLSFSVHTWYGKDWVQLPSHLRRILVILLDSHLRISQDYMSHFWSTFAPQGPRPHSSTPLWAGNLQSLRIFRVLHLLKHRFVVQLLVAHTSLAIFGILSTSLSPDAAVDLSSIGHHLH